MTRPAGAAFAMGRRAPRWSLPCRTVWSDAGSAGHHWRSCPTSVRSLPWDLDLCGGSAIDLVTGGAGFIGSHLVAALCAEGRRVRVLDNLSTGRRTSLPPGIELIEGDITDLSTCRDAVRGVERLFHLAALPSVQRSVEDPLPSHTVNTTGTLHLLIAARDSGVRRFVYSASSSAYGDTEVLPKHEDMPARPLSPYAAQKYLGELYCEQFHRLYGVETVALRYFNVFGPRQNPRSPYGAVVPKFISALLSGEPPVIFGDGEQSRDFTYVDNAVAANLRAAEAPSRAAGRTYNIGSGRRYTLNELLARLHAITGTTTAPRFAPARSGDVRHSLAAIEAAGTELGYEVLVDFDRGLERTVRAFRTEL